MRRYLISLKRGILGATLANSCRRSRWFRGVSRSACGRDRFRTMHHHDRLHDGNELQRWHRQRFGDLCTVAGVSGSAYGLGLVDEAGVFGFLSYSFEVIRGNPGDIVPVDIDTELQAIPNSIGYVFSEIGVTAYTSAGVTICSSACGAGSGEAGFTGTLQVGALSGAVDTVHLEAEVIGALGGPRFEIARAGGRHP
jgi:hypothetical protein